MKRRRLWGLVAALFASCTVQEADVLVDESPVFYATIEQPDGLDTKVYANEQLQVRWHENDCVSIFNKTTNNQKYRFTGQTGDNGGSFAKVDGDETVGGSTIPAIVSVYPYQSSTTLSGDEVLSVTLPAEQQYAKNSFGREANTMVSVSSNDVLLYKNACAYLILSLYGEGVSVSSITLKGNNGEKISGEAHITMPLNGIPSVEMADGSDSITLKCETPVALGATESESVQFWFVVPPVTFSKGFTVSIQQNTGKAFEKSTSKSITIERNILSRMAPIEAEYSAPAFQVADPISASYSWYNLLIPEKKEFIYPHILTSYIANEWYRWDNMEYIIAGEVPRGIECENVGRNNASDITYHADGGYWHIKDITPHAMIKACGGTWTHLKVYLDSHPEKLLMVSCAYDRLGGDTVEQLRENDNYQVLKDILNNENVIISNAGGNDWKILNENCPYENGGVYTSASVNSSKNNKITVVGYEPAQNNCFGDDTQSSRPIGFGNGNIVVPFTPLAIDGEPENGTTSSFPTAALSGSLGNFLSIIMKNHPGTTLEGAMTVMKSDYLIQDTFKYKNDQGETVDGEHWYFFDTEKFIREEILHKMEVESALSGSGTVALPSVGGLCYEGPGIQFSIGQTTYDSVESNRAILEAAVVAGTPVEWTFNPARAQSYGISGPVAITVRVMDTHARVVPDVCLTLLH